MIKKVSLFVLFIFCLSIIGCGEKKEETVNGTEVNMEVDAGKESVVSEETKVEKKEEAVQEIEIPDEYVEVYFQNLKFKCNKNFKAKKIDGYSSIVISFDKANAFCVISVADIPNNNEVSKESFVENEINKFYSDVDYEELIKEKATFNGMPGVKATGKYIYNEKEARIEVNTILSDSKGYYIVFWRIEDSKEADIFEAEINNLLDSLEFVQEADSIEGIAEKKLSL